MSYTGINLVLPLPLPISYETHTELLTFLNTSNCIWQAERICNTIVRSAMATYAIYSALSRQELFFRAFSKMAMLSLYLITSHAFWNSPLKRKGAVTFTLRLFYSLRQTLHTCWTACCITYTETAWMPQRKESSHPPLFTALTELPRFSQHDCSD
jgi:hypothetical protein